MARLPQLLVVLALIGATAAAFAVTERLKLERSPITATRIENKVFSPVCGCAKRAAELSFVLRRAETITVEIVDRDGERVRTLARARPVPVGRVSFRWNGRDGNGRVVAEGSYRPRVRLRRHGREIILPNLIRVDTTAPRIRLGRVNPRVFSPDGDGRRDRVTLEYVIGEPSWAMLLVDGRRRAMKRFRTTEGTIVWSGRIDGRTVRPGAHELALRAVDQAGNRSDDTRVVPVLVRYVVLSRERIEVVAGRRFSVQVLRDARAFRWRLAGRTGSESGRYLVQRSPQRPGRYTLFVTVGSHGAQAEVVVTSPPQPQGEAGAAATQD